MLPVSDLERGGKGGGERRGMYFGLIRRNLQLPVQFSGEKLQRAAARMVNMEMILSSPLSRRKSTAFACWVSESDGKTCHPVNYLMTHLWRPSLYDVGFDKWEASNYFPIRLLSGLRQYSNVGKGERGRGR